MTRDIKHRMCPPGSEKRLLTGVGDVLSIFDAHSDYDMSMSVSVLAGVLAAVTISLPEEDMVRVMREFGEAVADSRAGLQKTVERIAKDEAERFLAQLEAVTKKEMN